MRTATEKGRKCKLCAHFTGSRARCLRVMRIHNQQPMQLSARLHIFGYNRDNIVRAFRQSSFISRTRL